MATIQKFRAYRPAAAYQHQIPALPYDVMSTQEARAMASGNPLSFLHVDKSEIDLPEAIDPYDPSVYAKAGENLSQLKASGALVQDAQPYFYLYRQTWRERTQTGLVCCASIDDYLNETIKKHEHTRSDKEADRVRHVDACNANTGPIFLTYRMEAQISLIQEAWAISHTPVYDFETGDGVAHQVWVIDDVPTQNQLEKLFGSVANLYIADGHHRCAAAVKVGQNRRLAHPEDAGCAEFNYFLAILFPDEQLTVMDYNRVVADLNALSEAAFLDAVGSAFAIEKIGKEPYQPTGTHAFGMYLGGCWYALQAKETICNSGDPVERLDVSILQNHLLAPILGIQDPKTDQRIDFIGGIRGLEELEKRVHQGMKVAFSLYPTTVGELMEIADAGKIMPPKSTWFEPKLLSGIFIHDLA